MATTTPPTDPDSLAVLHALSVDDLHPQDAHNAVAGIQIMAGRNVIAAIEAHTARIDAQIATVNDKIGSMRWVIGIGFSLLAALIAALRLFA